MFLKLMDANADTIETHFALGALYRRRGEVERAIRIHQNLLARDGLAPEHREQALLALAQDYLRAGVLDRAEGLFQQVSEVPRLRASALDALRGVYERQHEWQQALDTYRQLARIKAAPPRKVAAHYLCELAALALERGDIDGRAAAAARGRARERAVSARGAAARANRRARGTIASWPCGCCGRRSPRRPSCCRRSCRICSTVGAAARTDAVLAELVAQAAGARTGRAEAPGVRRDRRGSGPVPRRCALRIETVFSQDATLQAPSGSADAGDEYERVAHEIGALLAHAEKYRCNECGFSRRAVSIGTAPRVMSGTASRPTRSSNCAETVRFVRRHARGNPL